MSEIYQPAEDSWLLSEVLKEQIKDKNIKCLDLGSGTGIQAQILIYLGVPPENVTLTDINPESIKYLEKKFPFSKVVRSDLFNQIQEEYDLIIFNPPYLPTNIHEPESSRIATTGGEQGSEIINEFLKQAKSHLNQNGKIFLLTSSLTKNIKWQGWKHKILAEKNLFMERLFVLELNKQST